ncbi:unnamed protein product [Caenorhabditis sp. 36 PRJEB53466]|nr:unnamed protein product [Caenorhabditis sp. 36 PRJEB53466]
MGLVISLVAPFLSENNSDEDSRILLGPAPKTRTITQTFESQDDGIKYLSKHGPPTVLGPTPGANPAPRNPISGVPDIHPPSDTATKVADSSTYDTLQMTPDVDWSKKTMAEAPIDKKRK